MLTVLGQPRALAQLQRSLASGRLAATWIFAGPPGVGKMRAAIQLAKTVLCDHPRRQPNGDTFPMLPPDFPLTLPCDACESCRAIDNKGGGSHPDLHLVTKELIRYHDKSGTSKGTTLSIHVIRGEITGDPAENKEAKIAKRSFRGKGKFFIVDEAELMELPAQNALLKTLEEPPPHTYLILITPSPQELLSTIRSRSQIVTFSELPTDVIIPGLIGAGVPSNDAALLARLARGSLGRALRWADDIRIIDEKNAKAADRKAKAKTDAPDDDDDDNAQPFTPGGILGWTRDLAAALDNLVAGRQSASAVAEVIASAAAQYSKLHLVHDKLASADRAKRDGIALMMTIAAEWFADRLRHGLGVPSATLLPGQTGALDHALVPKLIATARAAESEIDLNANDKILLAATTTMWEKFLTSHY
ncbi:MAG TPA: DNA polymerase III subunit [Phycisphaerae bacterium]|nr:DNA polymerase III subunit [Phycisphaerae bacterium]